MAIAFIILVVKCIFLVISAYFYLGRAWITNSEKWWGECQTAALSKRTQEIRTGNWRQRKKAGSAHQVDRGKTFVRSSIRFSDDNNIDGVKMWKWHRSVTRCYQEVWIHSHPQLPDYPRWTTNDKHRRRRRRRKSNNGKTKIGNE